MPWQIALAFFYILSVCQALLQRSYSQKSSLPESYPPAISYLIGVTPLGILVGLLLRHHVHWSWWLVFLLALEGLFIGFYNWLSFMAIRRLPLARFQTLYQLYEPVVVLLGWTLLAEKLTPPEMIGGVLILTAALLAIRAPRKAEDQLNKRPLKINRGVILTISAAVSMGIGLVTEKAALRHMDIGAYFIFGYGTQTLALLLLAGKDVKKTTLRAVSRYDFRRLIAMGILSATVGFFYIISIVNSDNISLITALSAFTLPLIVLSGYIILHERDDRRLLLGGVGLGFLGLIVSALH